MPPPVSGPDSVSGRRLILRGDGSPTIGLGHLMRLLALGQAWADAGGQVEALIGQAPEPVLERYRRESFRVRRFQPGGRRGDDGPLSATLLDDPSAVAAVDRPGLSVEALEALGRAADRTLIFDDLARLAAYPVGLVLNQNAHADRTAYASVDEARLLLGLRYVVLRREFRSPVPGRRVPAMATRLLVTFGGGDPSGMTERTLAGIARLPDRGRSLEVRVVVGAANPAVDRIVALAAATAARVAVERGIGSMLDAMLWAHLAITSGGSTVWELARAGCPSLVVSTVPGEVPMMAGLGMLGLFDPLGSPDRLDDQVLADAIARRLHDVAWRDVMARRGRRLVDGQGAPRVVAAIAGLPRA